MTTGRINQVAILKREGLPLTVTMFEIETNEQTNEPSRHDVMPLTLTHSWSGHKQSTPS